MLRKRLITVLMFNDGVLFRTKVFNPDYRYTLNFVDAWSVDEIVVLDVTRPGQGRRENFYQVVQQFARGCFVPLAVGGGIRTLDDVKAFLDLGADKIIINTEALRRPAFIGEIAKLYGSQCVVVSIDARKRDDGEYEVYGAFATEAAGMTAAEWARQAQDEGAGEILVTAVEKDGSVEGYDLDLCRQTSDAVTIPVLICGGAGNWKHFVDGFTTGGASAACTANIYHFTEASIKSAKTFLGNAGIDIRE
jgi:imidazole glycerol-phosphate synthase subunit HisF